MQVARALEVRRVAVLDVGAARLEVAAVRAAGDFLVAVVTGQPHLDVVGLARGEAQVARAQRDDAVRKAELLEQVFRLGGHALELVVGVLRRGKLHHFDLVELVLADDAARVAARRARLFAEARGERGVPARQRVGVEHLARMQVRERDLGGRDEEHVARHVVGVVFELGQLTGAHHGLALHDHRRPPFFEAAGSVRVEEVVDERALEACTCATEHGEAAAGNLVAALEIENVEVGAKIPVGLGLEALGREVARGAPATALGVLGLVLADGRRGAGDVGHMQHEVMQLGIDGLALRRDLVELLIDGTDALLGCLGLVLLALAHHLADGLRRSVALLLQRLFLHDGGAAVLVEA